MDTVYFVQEIYYPDDYSDYQMVGRVVYENYEDALSVSNKINENLKQIIKNAFEHSCQRWDRKKMENDLLYAVDGKHRFISKRPEWKEPDWTRMSGWTTVESYDFLRNR